DAYTLSLHDALPILLLAAKMRAVPVAHARAASGAAGPAYPDAHTEVLQKLPPGPSHGVKRSAVATALPADVPPTMSTALLWGSRSEEHTSELQSLAY